MEDVLDSFDPKAEYDDGPSLYEYAFGDPIFHREYNGLQGHPGSNPRPKPKPKEPIGPVTPLPSDSPECDKYDCNDSYAGANARCFCKCAGDSPWSNYVRGCLRKLFEQVPRPITRKLILAVMQQPMT